MSPDSIVAKSHCQVNQGPSGAPFSHATMDVLRRQSESTECKSNSHPQCVPFHSHHHPLTPLLTAHPRTTAPRRGVLISSERLELFTDALVAIIATVMAIPLATLSEDEAEETVGEILLNKVTQVSRPLNSLLPPD